MRNYIYTLLFIIHSTVCMATTFVPVTVKTQIKESEAILVGVVESIDYQRDEEGKIETKVTIFSNKWLGLNPGEDNLAEIYYPGGIIGDVEYKVQGSPKLNLGENVVLFTRKHNEKQYIQNLGLGKFSIQKFGNKDVMVNQIFPRYPDVGQIGLDHFYGLAEWVKKEKFTERFKDKYEIEKERRASAVQRKIVGRSVASTVSEESKKTSIIWLIIFLGGLALVAQILRKKEK